MERRRVLLLIACGFCSFCGILYIQPVTEVLTMERLNETFFHRPCLTVASELVGKLVVRRSDGVERVLRITETEAYCGESDTACHAHRGRTARTEVLYACAGTAYVYLCYGIHWLFNVVTGGEGEPEAVLIRACEGADGPGKLTKFLGITGSDNRKYLVDDDTLYIADDGFLCRVSSARRVGIAYASQEDQARPWRFIMDKEH